MRSLLFGRLDLLFRCAFGGLIFATLVDGGPFTALFCAFLKHLGGRNDRLVAVVWVLCLRHGRELHSFDPLGVVCEWETE